MEVKDYSENYGEGWISIYRSLKKKSWYNKPDYLAMWIHLLLKANHKEQQIMFAGGIINLKPGEFVTGRKVLSEETGINEAKVQRLLSYFETKEQQIEQRTDRQKRIITIKNWDIYQQSEQRVNNERTTSEQRVNTDNNINNINNINKNTIKPKRKASFLKISFNFEKQSWINLNGTHKSIWIEAYPALSIDAELNKMKAWLLANPKNRKSNYERFINNWLSRAQDGASKRGGGNLPEGFEGEYDSKTGKWS